MSTDLVLVTGAGGFIGSHLTERLVRDGKRVRAFVHYNASGSLRWLERSPVLKDIEVVAGDIRDYDSVSNAVKGATTVYHLAALIGIPYSYVSPLAYLRTNIEGTYNILQSCRLSECPNVMITSTSETYGTAQFVPITELHPCVGQSPYSATKIAADQLAISFHRSFGLPVKIVRPFNTYGERQSARAIIPTVISQLLSGKKTLTLGNLTPTRDLTYVADTVEGFMAIAQTPACVGEAVNIGMGKEVSIKDLALLIAKVVGVDIEFATDEQRVRPNASEVERLLCDNSKLKRLTGWEPKHSLAEGLANIVAWMKLHLDQYKPDVYNV